MVDALRAALRLLPAVRPSVGGTCGTCSRVPKARIHSAPEQSALLTLKVHPQIVNFEKAPQGGTGIVRFARAVLAYVGAGLSAVTANQLAGPSILQAKELRSAVGSGNCRKSATDTSEMWQRASANCHMVHEDAIRSTKLAHCPLPHTVSKCQDDPSHSVGHSYYWSNSLGSADVRFSPDAKLDLQWQFSPSAHREYRSKLGGLDDSVNCRFSKPTGLQALAAESNFSAKGNRGLTCTVSDYNTAAELDLELEWQLIVDPQPKSSSAVSCDNIVCEEDEISMQQALKSDGKQDEPFHTLEVNSGEVGTSKILTKNNRDGTLHGSQHGSGLDKQQTVVSKRDNAFEKCADHLDTKSKSCSKKSLLSHKTDKETFPAMFAQKGVARLENCDLPTPQTRPMERLERPTRQARLMSKTSLASVDIGSSLGKKGDMSRSLDKSLLASLLRGNEPTRLDNSDLPSSPLLLGRPDPTKVASVHLHDQIVSQPQDIPSTLVPPSTRRGSHSFSADSRNTSWNGGGGSRGGTNRSSGLLGEALCHSQTRAREAEKKVHEAHEEKERLLRLFFQEASLSLTYRQWVTFLQAENTWLRMYARNEPITWMHQNIFSPFSAMECLSRTRRWKNFGQDYALLQMEPYISAMKQEKNSVQGRDSNEIVMGCTLGLAFALGLSLAGAGLMLSWSMGWIFLACSVSM